MKNQIIQRDVRHPITVAFATAIKEKLVSIEQIALWQKEMESLVVEITKKLFGFLAIGAVRKGLDHVLGVLSLAVANSTKGEYNPDAWAKCLVKNGPKMLAKQAIQMVQAISTMPAVISLGEDPVDSVSAMLFNEDWGYSTAVNFDDKTLWEGYRRYSESRSQRLEQQKIKKLLLWLMEHKIRTQSSVWVARIEKLLGEAAPSADQVTNTILFRICVGAEMPEDIALGESDFKKARNAYEANPKRWIKSAKKRYDDMVEEVPLEIREALVWHRDWFDTRMSNGPEPLPCDWIDCFDHPNFAYLFLQVPRDLV